VDAADEPGIKYVIRRLAQISQESEHWRQRLHDYSNLGRTEEVVEALSRLQHLVAERPEASSKREVQNYSKREVQN